MFQRVSEGLQGVRGHTKEFQGVFRVVSRHFWGAFKRLIREVSERFQDDDVLRMFQGAFKRTSGPFQRGFKAFLNVSWISETFKNFRKRTRHF